MLLLNLLFGGGLPSNWHTKNCSNVCQIEKMLKSYSQNWMARNETQQANTGSVY